MSTFRNKVYQIGSSHLEYRESIIVQKFTIQQFLTAKGITIVKKDSTFV